MPAVSECCRGGSNGVVRHVFDTTTLSTQRWFCIISLFDFSSFKPLNRSRDIQMDIIAMRRIPFMDDITLSTQLRAEQLKQLLLILKSWEGPVSAAIYIDRLESQTFVNYLRNNLVLRTRTNLDIHIVKSRGVSQFYS